MRFIELKIKKEYSFLNIFLVFSIFASLQIFNYGLGIALIIILYWYLFTKKVTFNIKSIIFVLIALVWIFLYCFFIKSNQFILISEIEKWICYSPRMQMINYVQENNTSVIGGLVNMTLFNYKSPEAKLIYKDMVKLSIVQLIVISGIHLFYLSKLVKKIFRKEKLAIGINITIFLILTYFLNYSFSILRTLIMYIISKISRLKKYNQIDRLALTGIIIILLCPKGFYSLSFQMTFVASLAIAIFENYQKKIYFASFFQSLFVTLFMLPLVISINGRYSILSLLYCYLFTWIYIFNFFVFLFLFYIPGISVVFQFNYYLVKITIDLFMKINFEIKIGINTKYLIPIYYDLLFFVNQLLIGVYALKGNLHE